MTWKDKKALENQKVTELGGKVWFLIQSYNFYEMGNLFFFFFVITASKETEATTQCSESTDEEAERKRGEDGGTG